MASYLATATIGEFDLTPTRPTASVLGRDRPRPVPAAPHRAPASAMSRSRQLASVLQATAADDRRARRRRELSFWVDRDTEPNWDFFFVEAHTAGTDDWTTLPRPERPHAARTPASSARLARAAPVPRALPDRRRRRHVRADGHDRRLACGERAERRLRAVVGRPRALRRPQVEVALTLRERRLLPVTAASSSTTSSSRPAPASTSFEDDGDTLDGWTVPGRAAGSPAEPERLDRRHGRAGAAPAGDVARAALARAAGDHRLPRRPLRAVPVLGRRRRSSTTTRIGFALENQTRPIYSRVFFDDRGRRTTASSSTSWPTSGSATASRAAGATSGSTRASRPTRSGCGPSARAAAPRRRLRRRSRRSRPTTRSGAQDRRPGPEHLFDPRSTTAAR